MALIRRKKRLKSKKLSRWGPCNRELFFFSPCARMFFFPYTDLNIRSVTGMFWNFSGCCTPDGWEAQHLLLCRLGNYWFFEKCYGFGKQSKMYDGLLYENCVNIRMLKIVHFQQTMLAVQFQALLTYEFPKYCQFRSVDCDINIYCNVL